MDATEPSCTCCGLPVAAISSDEVFLVGIADDVRIVSDDLCSRCTAWAVPIVGQEFRVILDRGEFE